MRSSTRCSPASWSAGSTISWRNRAADCPREVQWNDSPPAALAARYCDGARPPRWRICPFLVMMAILPCANFIHVGLYLGNYPSLISATVFSVIHLGTTATNSL